ncbi:DUF2029 domain-containing protein [bacterium]|nr:DUF2029 domain-containing protein [bacterium]
MQTNSQIVHKLFSNRIFAILLWGVFLFFAFLILKLAILPSFNNTRGDFANYYTAACLVKKGAPLARAYQDFTWFQMEMDRHGIVHQVGGFIPHPPPTAMVFLPLTFFDAVTAKNIWSAFNILLILVCVFGLARLTQLHWLPVAVIFLGTGFGLINNFLFGQMYLLLTATIVLGLWAHRRGYDVLAGILLTLMIPMKYFGILFLAYFAWKRQWRLVFSALATIIAVAGFTAFMAGFEPFHVFVTEVFPRHFRGEIQDPFAILFQSWASLFRRLFVYNATLNPAPPLHFPPAFFFLSSVAFWGFMALALWLFVRARLKSQNHHFLFEIGLLPLLFLIVSPSGTTYHFLLLTITTTAFMKILIDQQRHLPATVLAILFIVINLPHYLKLMPYAQDWLTPLGYSRLWLLLIFAALAWRYFRPLITLQSTRIKLGRCLTFAVLLLASLAVVAGIRASRDAEKDDGATWLRIDEAEFKRHQGLLMKNPDVGARCTVFSYCEFWNEQYTIFSTDSGRWTPPAHRNYYHPDLAPDDSSLLVQTVVNGRDEIWLSRGQGQEPEFAVAGAFPSWKEGGRSFVYVEENVIKLAAIEATQIKTETLMQAHDQTIFDLACSSQENFLAYCAVANDSAGKRFQLRLYDFNNGNDELLIEALDSRLEQPAWSPDEKILLFAGRQTGNREVYAFDFATRKIHQLTHHRGDDTSPVWDAVNDRILFTSDRGRGLEFSAIFWLPAPTDFEKGQ